MAEALARNRSGQRGYRGLMAGLLFVVLAAGGLVVANLDAEQRQMADDRLVLATTGEIQSALQTELHRRANLGEGLRSIPVGGPELDSLIDGVETAATVAGADIRWAVRSLEEDGAPGVVLAGDPDVFDSGVTRQFDVPNGTWEIAAVGVQGSGMDVRGVVMRLLALLVSAALAWAAYRVLRIRDDVIALSLHDPLTGLANRRLLSERFDQAVALAERADRPLHAVYLDVDNFKPVNEAFGHHGGDQVLVELGRRLAARVRAADTVARIGGDEFVVLAPDTDTVGVRQLVIDLREVLAEPVMLDGGAIAIAASFGIAMFPGDGTSMDDLLHTADARMYEDKRKRQTAVIVLDDDRAMQ